jgi:DNA-binding MarR family transcriptional regulator
MTATDASPAELPDGAGALASASERFVFAVLRATRAEAWRNGLLLPQLRVLRALRHTGSVPVSQLVVASSAPPSTVTGVLDGLVGAGLVARSHSARDRRQVLVSLTPEGQRLAERVDARLAARWRPILERVAPSRASIAIGVMDEIRLGLRSVGDGRVRRPPIQGRGRPPRSRAGRRAPGGLR